jgi:hypothetical protein
MFCRTILLCLLNCVTETVQVTEGCILSSPAFKYNRDLHTPRLAEMFEGARQNCKLKKKFLSRANGDFERQNKVLRAFHKFLLITELLSLMHIIIVIFPIMASSRNAISNKMWQ